MKKNGNCECGQVVTPTAGAHGKREPTDSERNRKTYLGRLEEMKLTEPPVAARAKAPTHAEVARLAAALSKETPGASPNELAARAVEIWNASARAMFVEAMAGFVVKGICYFDREDWATHCRALVALFDDARGAIPGQSSVESSRESGKQARIKAGAAVAEIWKREDREGKGEGVLEALFHGVSESKKSRSKKLLSLLGFAQARVDGGGCHELSWRAVDGNRLKACLMHGWEPLAFPADEACVLETAAKAWLEFPRNVTVSNVGALPVLARWLTVLRMEQLVEAKSRS
jgi:hypothetical protein